MSDLIRVQSIFSEEETVDRLVKNIEQEGWHVFARIRHSEEAKKVGLELRPTELILFGNPEIGTFLMENAQTAAIDLPMKVLVIEDSENTVQVLYNDFEWLKNRHQITDEETLNKIQNVVKRVVSGAVK